MSVLGYDLGSIPDVDPTDEAACDRFAEQRAEYLVRVADLRESLALGLAYSELGCSHSGIANQCDVTEATVDAWMDDIARRFGERALESRPQSDPVEVLE